MSDLMQMFSQLDAGSRESGPREKIVKSPFPYPGSKRKSLPHILPLLPYSARYVEVFGGSGIVLLNRASSTSEVFNDRCSGITAFYRCLRDKQQDLKDRLECILHSREEFTWCRDTWENCEDDVERAARWYYMLVMSFGSMGRAFGRSTALTKNVMAEKYGNYFHLFPSVHYRLKNVLIENQDWRQLMKDFDSEETVFYLDPPYYKSDPGCYAQKMPEEDHRELCEAIFDCKGFCALSGYDCAIYEEYPWNMKHTWTVASSMTGLSFTEENNQSNRANITARGVGIENLWIKEARK